ncbi:unnamed protein product [Xylocopa violacea]|uniref:Uncharacterized protein n=1 Tax=Xylocopa violacea TaxID=135666 RepID=A0ABP1MZT8_XYLVO
MSFIEAMDKMFVHKVKIAMSLLKWVSRFDPSGSSPVLNTEIVIEQELYEIMVHVVVDRSMQPCLDGEECPGQLALRSGMRQVDASQCEDNKLF